MDYDRLIIDGYNLMHQGETFDGANGGLQSARQRLVRRVERVAPAMAAQATIVFDGREGGRDAAFDAPHLEVLFSPAGLTADGLIERIVHEADHPERILVVTSDWIEQRLVSVFGAAVISCREFLLRCEQAESQPARALPKRRPPGAVLGDFFPS